MSPTATELKWTKDFAEFSQSCSKLVVAKFAIVSCLLASSVIDIVCPAALCVTILVQWIISAFLGFSMIQSVWNAKASPEKRIEERRTPWIRLSLLELTYAIMMFLLWLLLFIPGIWWTTCSSLAFVIVVVEHRGIIESLTRSHQLIKGKFWLAVRYLGPINLLLVLPTQLAYGGVGVWSDFLREQASIPPPLLVVIAAASLVTAAISWFVWLTSLGLLVRLYAYVTESAWDS